jgi:hypothetical protein
MTEEVIERVEDRLADFTRDKRVIILSGMSLVIGALSALVAYALVWPRYFNRQIIIASVTGLLSCRSSAE